MSSNRLSALRYHLIATLLASTCLGADRQDRMPRADGHSDTAAAPRALETQHRALQSSLRPAPAIAPPPLTDVSAMSLEQRCVDEIMRQTDECVQVHLERIWAATGAEGPYPTTSESSWRQVIERAIRWYVRKVTEPALQGAAAQD
jgi:hypothetical protein